MFLFFASDSHIVLGMVDLDAGNHIVKVSIVGKSKKSLGPDAIVDCVTVSPAKRE